MKHIISTFCLTLAITVAALADERLAKLKVFVDANDRNCEHEIKRVLRESQVVEITDDFPENDFLVSILGVKLSEHNELWAIRYDLQQKASCSFKWHLINVDRGLRIDKLDTFCAAQMKELVYKHLEPAYMRGYHCPPN